VGISCRFFVAISGCPLLSFSAFSLFVRRKKGVPLHSHSFSDTKSLAFRKRISTTIRAISPNKAWNPIRAYKDITYLLIKITRKFAPQNN